MASVSAHMKRRHPLTGFALCSAGKEVHEQKLHDISSSFTLFADMKQFRG